MTDEQPLTKHPIEWAMDTDIDPVFTLANWLVQDALDTNSSAVEVLTSRETTVDEFRILKRLFKQLRTQGELPADRRLGARLYAASIAGALVFHDRLTTTQKSPRLLEAFRELAVDRDMPDELVELAVRASTMMPD